MMEQVLVTGATGYIGRHLMAHLAQTTETRLIGFSRQTIQTEDSRIASLSGDLLKSDLKAILQAEQPDTIFHAVGLSPLSPFEDQLQTHVVGTRRLLQAVVEADLIRTPRIVVVGSAAEYGFHDQPTSETSLTKPEGEYGICKLAQTQIAQTYARRYDLPVIIGRVFNAYGYTSPALVVASLASQLVMAEKQGTPTTLHLQKLTSVRDFVHITDVATALVALAERGQAGEIYNIASGQGTTIQSVLELLKIKANLAVPVSVEASPDQTPDYSQAVIDKISAHTGWKPTVYLKDGLSRELDYWRAQSLAMAEEIG